MDNPVRHPSAKAFVYWGWGLLLFTVSIIVWGAWVRVSGSGAGCGDHWPLCHGQLIPAQRGVHTLIEVSHRLSTGLFGLLVLCLLWVSFRRFQKGHAVRYWAAGILLFTITESLLGAKLVLFELVDQSQSPWRIVVMPLHLANTFALLLCECMWLAQFVGNRPILVSELLPWARRYWFVILGVILSVGCSGALAALAVHLFPSSSLSAGLAADVAGNSPFLLRIRIVHPMLAVVLGGILVWVLHGMSEKAFLSRRTLLQFQLTLLFAVIFGLCTLIFLSPIWMKLVHLLIADILWVASVLLVLELPRTESAHV